MLNKKGIISTKKKELSLTAIYGCSYGNFEIILIYSFEMLVLFSKNSLQNSNTSTEKYCNKLIEIIIRSMFTLNSFFYFKLKVTSQK